MAVDTFDKCFDYAWKKWDGDWHSSAVFRSLKSKHGTTIVALKAIITLHEMNPITEPRGVICHMGSYGVTCHPTQVNAHRLNPSQ